MHGTGGTIARLVAEGVRVDLVTCTDGAEGEIHDPTLDPEEARPGSPSIRADELACSLDALGGGAIHHHLLGYRDSGMMGTEANEHPDSFWQADLEGATRRPGRDRPRGAPGGDRHLRRERQLRPPRPHQRRADRSRGVHRLARRTRWAVARFYEIAFVRERWES